MRRIKSVEDYVVDTEDEAIKMIEDFRAKQNSGGYQLGACGYKYKAKKAKGEIITEAWLVTVTKIYGEVWDGI